MNDGEKTTETTTETTETTEETIHTPQQGQEEHRTVREEPVTEEKTTTIETEVEDKDE